MIFSWFDGRESKEFGLLLGRMVMERLSLEGPGKGRPVEKKHDAMMNKLGQQIEKFTEKHALNVYKKAKVGSEFKRLLKDSGYDPEYVDQLTHWIMLKL